MSDDLADPARGQRLLAEAALASGLEVYYAPGHVLDDAEGSPGDYPDAREGALLVDTADDWHVLVRRDGRWVREHPP